MVAAPDVGWIAYLICCHKYSLLTVARWLFVVVVVVVVVAVVVLFPFFVANRLTFWCSTGLRLFLARMFMADHCMAKPPC